MDWINCNICCRQPGDEKERMFMLSSCGHIFCDLCLSQAESRNKCKVCSAQCQLIQLSSKMKPDAEMFFQEPTELLKKHQTQMIRLLEFQKEHRIRLVSFHRKMLVKYKELEKRFKQAVERVQLLEKENMKLKEIISSGVKGGGEYGCVGPSLSPHDSYQRVISSSVMRNSPQGTTYQHVSPSGGNRISPGRLTLVKSKNAATPSRVSPTLPQNEARAKIIQNIGRPGTFLHMKGYPNQMSATNGTSTFASPDSSRMQSPVSSFSSGNFYSNGVSISGPMQPSKVISPSYIAYPHPKKLSQPAHIQGSQVVQVVKAPISMVASQEIHNPSRNYNMNVQGITYAYPKY